MQNSKFNIQNWFGGGSSRFVAFCVLSVALLFAAPLHAEDKKAVVLGYDALDPVLMEKYMAEGKLPNFKKLREQGHYSKLETSYPPMSPAAWSTMVTGLNPGRTGISGFVSRAPGSYDPELDLVKANESAFMGGTRPTRAVVALCVGLMLLGLSIALGMALRFLASKLGRAPALHGTIPAAACIGVLMLSPLTNILAPPALFGVFGGILALSAIWGYGAVRMRLPLRTWLFPWLGLSVAVFAFMMRLPETLPRPETARAGESFWATMGKQGLRAKVLGGPVEWPARNKDNVSLTTGLATPDVMGTHHTYTLYTEPPHAQAGEITEMGGRVERLEFKDNVAKARLLGPPARFDVATWKRWERGEIVEMPRETIRFEIVKGTGDALTLRFKEGLASIPVEEDHSVRPAVLQTFGGQPTLLLAPGMWSEHIRLVFTLGGLAKLHGTVRFKLLEGGNNVRLYAQPVQFDPLDTPDVFAVSAPSKFGEELAEEFGLYDTLGWVEATSALQDGNIDDQTFLETCEHAFEERRAQLLPLIERGEWDLLVCFFYEMDRVCHMMWRHMDAKHPAHDPTAPEAYKKAIENGYIRADNLLGEVMAKLPANCVLFVVSDHGFAPYYASVNLNRWLLDYGYLKLNKPTKDVSMDDLFTGKGRYFGTYDWANTRAYCLGLGKIYLNIAGREPQGIVHEGKEAADLREEIRRKLLDLRDANGGRVIREVKLNKEVWDGPLLENDCDLVVLFENGYRISWQTTLGGAHENVIMPNLRNWSGDHCTFAPDVVPGVLFSNRGLQADKFRLVDVGDTVLRYFGVPPSEERRKFDGRAWEVR